MASTPRAGRARWLFAPALLLTLLAPSLLLAAGEARDEGSDRSPRWGIVGRYGYYGVPDWILDMLFDEHPSVDGTIAGGEVRYYGASGPRGAFSVGLALDVGSSEGFGAWRESEEDTLVVGGGEVDIAAATLTFYLDLWPESPLHPYVGAGLGAAWAEGRYVRDGEKVTVEEFVPAIHLPAGLLLNLGEHLGIALEGRVIDGISWGGSLQLRF